MIYGFEHRFTGARHKRQAMASAFSWKIRRKRQMNDPKMPVYAERFLPNYIRKLPGNRLVQEAMEKNRGV